MKNKIFTTLLSTIVITILLSGCGNSVMGEYIYSSLAKTAETDAEDEADLKENDIMTLLVKKTDYIADDNILTWYEYEYDNSGNQTKETYFHTDGRIAWCHKYEYDTNDRKTKVTGYKEDDSIDWVHKYEYDSNGNKMKETCYNIPGGIFYWRDYEYDYFGDKFRQNSFYKLIKY